MVFALRQTEPYLSGDSRSMRNHKHNRVYECRIVLWYLCLLLAANVNLVAFFVGVRMVEML